MCPENKELHLQNLILFLLSYTPYTKRIHKIGCVLLMSTFIFC